MSPSRRPKKVTFQPSPGAGNLYGAGLARASAASLANGLQAAAYGTGLPSAAAVQTFIAGNHPNVQQAFAAGNATTLAAVTLGVQSRTDTAGSGLVFDSAFSTNFTTAQLAASNPAQDNVDVGLLDGTFTGGQWFPEARVNDHGKRQRIGKPQPGVHLRRSQRRIAGQPEWAQRGSFACSFGAHPRSHLFLRIDADLLLHRHGK